MKTFHPVKATRLLSSLILAGALILVNTPGLQAQNLVTNSNFTGGSYTGWSTSSSIEVNPQTTYGGPSSSIYVTEIDVERTLNQQVCILPGLSYTFTYQATRRPQSGTPTHPGIQVKVTGTTSNTDYVNTIQPYTNTTWVVQSNTFTITIPAGSTDKKVNIQFASNNNSSTYGILIWDIELAPASTNLLSIAGPATSGISTPNNFSLTNSPAGVSYSWSFSADASQASSTSATPSNISWASLGTKNVNVAVSNSVCMMASYSKAVTVSTTLPVQLGSFTGAIKDNSGQLTWVSEKEADGRYFVIERSANGVDFDSIGMVASLNAAVAYTYHYTDKTMAEGNNYYRLRHVDRDDAIFFSQIITLDNNTTVINNAKMNLFPNPAVSTLNYNITSEKAGQVAIRIFTPSGICVMTSQVQLSAGVNQQSINIGHLSNGSYFMKVADIQGNFQYTQAFVKI